MRHIASSNEILWLVAKQKAAKKLDVHSTEGKKWAASQCSCTRGGIVAGDRCCPLSFVLRRRPLHAVAQYGSA